MQKPLVEEAARIPAEPTATTFHLVVDAGQPSAFCGEMPGPDRGTWHRGHGLDDVTDAFTAGSTCCPLCVLAVGKMMERSRGGM